jgi:nucleotide-binding universal stress UspA family protein
MNILLAIDGSEASQAAIHSVRDRPWPVPSTVRVLNVVEQVYPPPDAPWTLAMGTGPSADAWGVREVVQQMLDHARELTEQVAEELRCTGLRVEAEALVGVPRNVIITVAENWEADLVIVGSHGRTGLKRWVLGSVAEAVVRHAGCSVEVARTRVS